MGIASGIAPPVTGSVEAPAFDEDDLTGLIFGIDASLGAGTAASGKGYTLDGAAVDEIHELSTNNYTITQGTGSARPAIGSIGGLNAFSCDGGDFFDLPSNAVLASGANWYPISFYAVVSASAAHNLFETLITIGASTRLDIMLNSGELRFFDETKSGTAIPTDGTAKLVWAQQHTSGIVYGINNQVVLTVGITSATTIGDTSRRLFQHTGGSNGFSGLCGEMKIFNKVHSPSEHGDSISHLIAKWSLS